MITLERAEVGLAEMRRKYEQAAGRLAGLKEDRQAAVESLQGAVRDVQCWEAVQALYLKAGEYAREQLKLTVESTVSAALQAVFEDDSEFKVGMRTVGGVAAAEWQLVSTRGESRIISDTEDGDGGAAADVTSLALRASLLELSRPRPEGPMILDEAGKHVSKEYSLNVAQFLKQYAGQTGRQVCLITHSEDLASVADVSYRVSQVDGVSEVERV